MYVHVYCNHTTVFIILLLLIENHISTFAQASLNFPGTILTVNNTSQTILLPFTDDNIALEQTEVVSLELRSIPDPESTCNQVHITTPNVTTIFIEDDDSKCDCCVSLFVKVGVC